MRLLKGVFPMNKNRRELFRRICHFKGKIATVSQ